MKRKWRGDFPEAPFWMNTSQRIRIIIIRCFELSKIYLPKNQAPSVDGVEFLLGSKE
jgi:hypothetical protein